MNHNVPARSKTAVFRLAFGRPDGRGNDRIWSVAGSTRTIASRPLSVIQAAPSGPVMTPCGDEPAPSGISRMVPVAGSRWPRTPTCWPVYQTPPSAAGETSWGCVPAGTSYSRSVRPTAGLAGWSEGSDGAAEAGLEAGLGALRLLGPGEPQATATKRTATATADRLAAWQRMSGSLPRRSSIGLA